MHYSRCLNYKWIFWVAITINLSKLSYTYSATPANNLQQYNQMPFLLSTIKHVIHPRSEHEIPLKRNVKKFNHKQYDVINLLWRKLKLFQDVDNSTILYRAVDETTKTTLPVIPIFKRQLPANQNQNIDLTQSQAHQHVQQVETISISRMFPLECPDPYAHRQHNLLQDPLLSIPVKKSPPLTPSTANLHNPAKQKSRAFLSRKKLSTMFPIRPFLTTTSSIEFDYFVRKEDGLKLTQKHTISSRDAVGGNNLKTSPTAPRFHIKAEGMLSPYKIRYEADIKRSQRQKSTAQQITQSSTIEYPEAFPITTSISTYSSPNTSQDIDYNSHTSIQTSTSTESDKIKFFEMYDNQNIYHSFEDTPFYDKYNSKKSDDNEPNDSVETKILLKHVDLDTSHNRHSNDTVKRIDRRAFKDDERLKLTSYNYVNNNLINNELKYVPEMTTKQPSSTTTTKSKLVNITKPYVKKPPNKTQRALWSEFPFAAVYVHDPSQVHCDAAAISPRWLVAAAACLHRHKLEVHPGDFRTAFVAYCSVNWRQPKSIVYVKRVVIHPEFQPYDEKRRVMYNIGAIKVINAMSLTCPGWSAASFMSHQFLSEPDGTPAVAIGWGLDRYGRRYSSHDLPTWPLMEYRGFIYTDSCPGNHEYQGLCKLEDHGRLDTFCLSLPPYLEEESDHIHGSLLIIGGKLSALYLQEERRSVGDQSAIYTGIWRLVPWIMETARETEDIESVLSIESL